MQHGKVIAYASRQLKPYEKSYADKHRRELEFQTGDHVFLKVSPTRGIRRFGIKGKLSPRFIGPFEILDQVGPQTDGQSERTIQTLEDMLRSVARQSHEEKDYSLRQDSLEEPSRAGSHLGNREVYTNFLSSFPSMIIDSAYSLILSSQGVETVMPITCVEDKSQRRLEVKARSTLMMGIPNEHQLKFNSIKDVKQLMEAIEKRFGEWNTHDVVWRKKSDLDTMSMDDLYNNLMVFKLEVKGMLRSNSSTQNMAFITSSNNNNTNGAVNIVQAVNTANGIHPDDLEEMDLKWQIAMLTMRDRIFLKNTRRKLNLNGNESIAFDKTKVECFNFHKRGHFARECITPRLQDNKNKESTRRNVHVETTNSLALVSCDGLGGYDWSDQVEDGPNYALMAYSTSSSDFEVSTDSNYSKTYLKTVETLKSQNENLLKDLKKSELMVLGYKAGLKLVEERLEFFKTNETIYSEDIKKLKIEIHCNEITIIELRKKLETVQKDKDGIQLTVEKLKNASKSLNKLIDSQIVDNCKKCLGYNTVPPPHIVETLNAKTSEDVPKVVKNDNGAIIIEDWKSDDEDESVPQPKIEKKIVKPSVAKNPLYRYKFLTTDANATPVTPGNKGTLQPQQPKGEVMETFSTIPEDILKWITTKAEAIQIILTRIDSDIYSTVDAGSNAIEMWKAIKRFKQGRNLGIWEVYFTERSQAATRNKGKAIFNPPQPIYDPKPEVVVDDDASSKEKEFDKNRLSLCLFRT
nr:ribonuclease H-like domain-containing protein [Tanacetum cinerariifolium]